MSVKVFGEQDANFQEVGQEHGHQTFIPSEVDQIAGVLLAPSLLDLDDRQSL